MRQSLLEYFSSDLWVLWTYDHDELVHEVKVRRWSDQASRHLPEQSATFDTEKEAEDFITSLGI